MNMGADTILASATPAALRQLAATCRESTRPDLISSHAVNQILGPRMVEPTLAMMRQLADSGWTCEQVAFLLDQLARSREQIEPPDSLFELVLSGPDLDDVPVRDTFAVVNELFVGAREEVILVGYAVHNGKVLFQRLAQQMETDQHLSVWMCLNIPRRQGDTSLPTQIVQRFSTDFFARHWPWERRPKLFYDARSLAPESNQKSSLHAKCIIVDRRTALVTSANFTAAGQQRNIEAGVLIHYKPHIDKLVRYLEGLRSNGVFLPVQTLP